MKRLKALMKKQKKPSFETLVRAEQEKLYKIAYSYMRNEQDALDVVQDAVMKGYHHFDKLHHLDYFSTWMIRILMNTAVDAIKRKRDVIYIEHEKYKETTNEELESVHRMDLEEQLDKLKTEQKTLIILRFYCGYSLREMAEMLNKPEGTIKSQLHRTLAEMKKNLGEGGEQYGKAWSDY
ncbi:sigma-70 family RNA polymerase sigma factor [Alkalihalobacterium bogoriense]|uniref:sigma-70 family RNA polymerase sigma factor n=1 Tax=Alkalihalobacterium bogoriense TaxID=246272 RepID=UPI00047A5DB6|nr:sigma-70 family RNA polymerase sigma factor [Alkalihalobacterium bogoriense]